MFRGFLRVALLTGLTAVAGAACDTTTDTGPIDPAPTEITEPPFEGTLHINSGATTSFAVTTIGTITAELDSLDPNPDSFLAVGLALGIWNGTSCQLVLTNDNVGIGSGIAGFANEAGNLCARIYDIGLLVEPVEFSVTIKHY